MARLTFDEIQALNERMEHQPAADILAWASASFGAGLAFASSFGAEDMVLLDLLLKSDRNARVFMLDTGRLHQETYDLVDAAGKRYGRTFEMLTPRTEALEALLKEQGPNGFYTSKEARHACCHVRKVEPLARALSGAEAWITGQRRSQSSTRADLRIAERDMDHGGILKLNPLAPWTEAQVWDYIREQDLPVNALHAKGYPSIGCAPCTRPVPPGEDIRSGRWWWEEPEHRECGLHR